MNKKKRIEQLEQLVEEQRQEIDALKLRLAVLEARPVIQPLMPPPYEPPKPITSKRDPNVVIRFNPHSAESCSFQEVTAGYGPTVTKWEKGTPTV